MTSISRRYSYQNFDFLQKCGKTLTKRKDLSTELENTVHWVLYTQLWLKLCNLFQEVCCHNSNDSLSFPPAESSIRTKQLGDFSKETFAVVITVTVYFKNNIKPKIYHICTIIIRAGNLVIRSSLIRSSLIRSSLIRSFAQIKWATVSNSLRTLKTNEGLWANRSGRSW